MARAYSLDLRKKVLSFFKVSNSKEETLSVFKICRSTLNGWLRLESKGALSPKIRRSSPRKVVPGSIEAQIAAQPDMTLPEIGLAIGVSSTSIWRHMKQLGITRKKRQLYTPKGARRNARNLKSV